MEGIRWNKFEIMWKVECIVEDLFDVGVYEF